MRKLIVLLFSLFILSGCGTPLFNTGGQAHYTYERCDGDKCIEIDLLNTKDIKSLSGRVEIKPDGSVLIILDEKEATGSDLAAIQANNATELINVVKSLVPGS